MYVMSGTGAYEVTNLPTLGMGTNGAVVPASPVPAPPVVAQLGPQQQRLMRTGLAVVGGLAGGMASAFFLRREDVGEERAKNLVKGSVIGGAASLLLVLFFQGVEGAAVAATTQPMGRCW